MEQLTLTDWLFFFCCSEKNRKSILKNIKKNNNYIEGVKSNPKSDSIYVLCNKHNIKYKPKPLLKGKLVKLIIY